MVKDMDKGAEIEFNYGLLGTVDGVCHVGIYPFNNESGNWCFEAEGCRVSQFRFHPAN